MNDTIVTVRGWLGSAPTLFSNDSKRAAALFRIGVTPRYFNRTAKQYQDGVTTWYAVRCYGTLALNAAASLHRGSPVLVRGKLNTRQYTDKDGVIHRELVIIADAVGIELTTGRAGFFKVSNSALAPMVPSDGTQLHTGSGAAFEAYGTDTFAGGAELAGDLADAELSDAELDDTELTGQALTDGELDDAELTGELADGEPGTEADGVADTRLADGEFDNDAKSEAELARTH